MRQHAIVLCLSLCLLFMAAGCEEQVYVCHSDASCVWLGVQGRCLSAGGARYCAFPYLKCIPGRIYDKCCQSGLQWHESAPMLIQNMCVDPSMAPMPDAGPPMMTGPDAGPDM